MNHEKMVYAFKVQVVVLATLLVFCSILPARATSPLVFDLRSGPVKVQVTQQNSANSSLTLGSSSLPLVSSLEVSKPLRVSATASNLYFGANYDSESLKQASCVLRLELTSSSDRQELGDLKLNIQVETRPRDFLTVTFVSFQGEMQLPAPSSRFADSVVSLSAVPICNGSRATDKWGLTSGNALEDSFWMGSAPQILKTPLLSYAGDSNSYLLSLGAEDIIGNKAIGDVFGYKYEAMVCTSNKMVVPEFGLPTSCRPHFEALVEARAVVESISSVRPLDRPTHLVVRIVLLNKFGSKTSVTNFLQVPGLPKSTGTSARALIRYSSCAVLNKVFSGGIRRSSSTWNLGNLSITTTAFVSPKGYALNSKLDKDKDGIACER